MNLKKILAMLMAVLMMLSASVTAFAAKDAVDVTKRGSISIILRERVAPRTVVQGASFKLYQVATAKLENGNIKYALTTEFQDSGVDLSNLRADGISGHLAAFAELNALRAVIGHADQKGGVVFSGLELGLYLVVQNGSISGYFPTDPFIISVPMTSSDGAAWIYDIDASPKVQAKPIPPSSSTTELTVVKQWVGSGEHKQNSINVSLLRDGAVVSTVTLNAGNRWTHTWNDLSKSYRWSVSETVVPEGYQVSYSFSGKTTTITNTFVPDIPDNPESLAVNKVWKDGGNENRPKSVTVELWKDDTRYATILLNAQNNWTHTWSNLPKSTEWHIKEVNIPENYEASYAVNGIVTTITNQYDPPQKPPIKPPLIQTGQLNWPIPVLAFGGVTLIVAGWMILWAKRKKDEDA